MIQIRAVHLRSLVIIKWPKSLLRSDFFKVARSIQTANVEKSLWEIKGCQL